MRCPRCHVGVRPGMSRCPMCGHDLARTPASAPSFWSKLLGLFGRRGATEETHPIDREGPQASGSAEPERDEPGPEMPQPIAQTGGVSGDPTGSPATFAAERQAPVPAQPTRPGDSPAVPPVVQPPVFSLAEAERGLAARAEEEQGRTVRIGGLRISQQRFAIAYCNPQGQWIPVATLFFGEMVLGRDLGGPLADIETLAGKHVRLLAQEDHILAEDLGSLNGLMIKLTSPVRLSPGVRFRIGNQLIEFQAAAPQKAQPLPAHGERLWTGTLDRPNCLAVIGADGTVCFTYPLTRRVTVIGRDPEQADLAFPQDELISRRHAAVRRTQEEWLLEDLNSSNGTYIQQPDKCRLRIGDLFLLGQALFGITEAK